MHRKRGTNGPKFRRCLGYLAGPSGALQTAESVRRDRRGDAMRAGYAMRSALKVLAVKGTGRWAGRAHRRVRGILVGAAALLSAAVLAVPAAAAPAGSLVAPAGDPASGVAGDPASVVDVFVGTKA